MPARNTLLILCIAALFASAWLFLFAPHAAQAPLMVPRDASPQQGEQPRIQDIKAQTSALVPARTQAQATLLISGHRYSVPLDEHITVLGAMQGLASSEALTFTGKEFPSLGFFVESINDVKNAGGKYWILYRNGAQSKVGASSATISPGDVIEWRYE